MKRDRQHLLLRAFLAGLLVLSACAHRATQPVPVEDRAPPVWIRVKPDDSAHYQGVGYAPLTLDPGTDRNLALIKAREDLLKDIERRFKPAVSSDVSAALWPRVDWAELEKSFADLSAFDIYNDPAKRRMWAYVKFDRGQLDKLLAKRKASMEPRALRYLADCDAARKAGNLVEATQQGVIALHYAAGPEGLLMAASQPGRVLRQDIEDELTAVIEQIELQKISGPEHARAAGLRDTKLVVQAVRRGSGQPLERLPIAFHFVKGGGDITPSAQTGADGQVSVAINSLDPRINPVEIEAVLNLQGILSSARLPALPDAALEFLKLPATTFPIALDPPRLLLSEIERGGTGGRRGAVKVNELAEAFHKQGMSVVDTSVNMLVNPEVFQKLEQGRDPGPVEGADLLGLVVISLQQIRKEKGKYQEIMYGTGEASFRLYDLERHVILMDIRLPQEVSGFSQGDIERSFFLQSLDELRGKVADTLADEPYMRSK